MREVSTSDRPAAAHARASARAMSELAPMMSTELFTRIGLSGQRRRDFLRRSQGPVSPRLMLARSLRWLITAVHYRYRWRAYSPAECRSRPSEPPTRRAGARPLLGGASPASGEAE